MKITRYIGYALMVGAFIWSEAIGISSPNRETIRISIGHPLEHLVIAIGGIALVLKK